MSTFFVVGESTSVHTSAEDAWEAWKTGDDSENPQWTLKSCSMENGKIHSTEIWVHDAKACAKFYQDVVLPAYILKLEQAVEIAQTKLANAKALKV